MEYVCLNRGTTGGNLSQEDFVKVAAETGFAGADVDINYGVQHGTAKLADLYATHHLRFGGWGAPDFRAESAKLPEGLAQLKKMAPVAAQLKADSCATWIMPSSEMPFLENWNFHVSRIKPIADILRDHGLRFGLEFVAPYHLRRKFKHEFIFTPGLMLELADAIGSNVGLLVDSFHCHTAGTTWQHLAEIPAEKIVLTHLNDAPRVPVGEVQDGQRVLPGNGGIDLVGFLHALRSTGYNGPMSLEVFNQQLREMPAPQAAALAWQATKRVLQAAG